MPPTTYTPELADTICGLLAEGISVRTICKMDGMPAASTVFLWLRSYPEFVAQYGRAKEESAEALAEEMLDIADDRGEDPQSRRVRIDTRKWLAAKLKPKKYGEKLELGGKVDGDMKLSGIVTFVEAKKDPGGTDER